jgi:hypothetical protein
MILHYQRPLFDGDVIVRIHVGQLSPDSLYPAKAVGVLSQRQVFPSRFAILPTAIAAGSLMVVRERGWVYPAENGKRS